MTIILRLSPEEERRLLERATESGQDVVSYVQRLIQRDIEHPSTLRKLVAPIHEDFRGSGMTEEELEEFLKGELGEVRKGHRAANSTAES